jgi:hypothetical protein
MSYTVPGCYTGDGKPVVVGDRSVVIYPLSNEGRAVPTPAQGAANALKAIANIPAKNAGVL